MVSRRRGVAVGELIGRLRRSRSSVSARCRAVIDGGEDVAGVTAVGGLAPFESLAPYTTPPGTPPPARTVE